MARLNASGTGEERTFDEQGPHGVKITNYHQLGDRETCARVFPRLVQACVEGLSRSALDLLNRARAAIDLCTSGFDIIHGLYSSAA